MKTVYDVVIIGGGPAGLSAALTLARGGRSVCILDEGKGRNQRAAHMMNFPSQDGTPPEEFKAEIRQDLKKYPKVDFVPIKVDSINREDELFIVNGAYKAKKILLAHGVKDIMPAIPGFVEIWGKTAFLCPYCHGYEFLNHKIALVAGEEVAKHMIPILRGLSQDVILFTNGQEFSLKTEFQNKGVQVYTEKIASIDHQGEKLKSLKLVNGEEIQRDCMFVKLDQHSTHPLGINLGCQKDDNGFYKLDETGMTTVNGVYAAGDVAGFKQAVLAACAGAMMTGTFINMALGKEAFG